jgi:transcriptional regulator with XRE-family HTH domain
MTILDKIDEMRRARGWSINYLAMEAMLTQSTLNNLYARQAEPKISTLRAICGAFNITLAQFFEECDGETVGSNKNGGTVSEITSQVLRLTEEQRTALLALIRTM